MLTGTVFAPNGVDPIPRVRVYAAVQINPYPTSYCDKCSAPIDPAYVSVKTAADGTFSLNLDLVPQSASITFAIQIGRFRKHVVLPVTACQTTALPPPPANATPAQLAANPTVLPGTSAAGDIPKIAVSSGNVDHLDQVLTTLGITEYDCYEGRSTTGTSTATCNEATAVTSGKVIADVLQDATQIGGYHMAFLSCAPGAYKKFMTTHNQQTISNNTQSWVANGGRMFVTDTAYDYVSQAFPSGITWAGPGGAPQPVDAANVGCAPAGPGGSSAHAVLYPTTIDDSLLAQWLSVVKLLPTPTPSPAVVNIQGFYQPWSVMAPPPQPTGTQLIADATMPLDVANNGTCTTSTMTDVPLTVQFDVPTCGRVVFSSYHTYTGTGASAMAANEKIMEYLIFDAAVCHQ